jgi:putative chitinase
MITAQTLRAIAPRANPAFVGDLAEAMSEILPQYKVDPPLRLAHFLAQAAHESDGFKTLHEYWGPTPAQKRYEGRKDLGNVRRGDGKRYLGRGIFQLTGRANYRRIGNKLGLPLEANPESAARPRNAVLIAAQYWSDHDLNAPADADDIVTVTRRINGGLNGLDDRRRYLRRAQLALAPPPQLAPAEPPMPALPTATIAVPPVASPVPVMAAQVADIDPLVAPDSPQGLMRLLQKALNERNYDCGAEDGEFGSLTRAAVLALKANEGLDTSTLAIRLSEVEAALPWVVDGRQDATVADLRARGATTIKGADAVQKAVAGFLGFFGISQGASTLDKAEAVSGTWARIRAIAEPFAGLWPWVMEHLWIVALVGGGLAIWLAQRSKQKRLAEYKQAKMQ